MKLYSKKGVAPERVNGFHKSHQTGTSRATLIEIKAATIKFKWVKQPPEVRAGNT